MSALATISGQLTNELEAIVSLTLNASGGQLLSIDAIRPPSLPSQG
jgi:hypothetical protein